MGVILRPLRPDDRPALAEILALCGAFSAEEVRAAIEILEQTDGDPSPDGYHVIVAEAPDTVRGYVCIAHIPLTRGTWHLYWICVDRAFQGRGIGQALLAAAESLAVARGGERLVLETSARPDYAGAHRFYERAGYRVVGRIGDFYRPGDDCLTYCKTLAGTAVPALVVAQSPGKGRGCFADRAIAAGTLVEEAPVVIVPQAQLVHLDRTILENYYFQWGEDGALLLGRTSLCNHDFAPNATFRCDHERRTIRVTALRDIAPGEEITLNYNGAPDDQSPLDDHYGIPQA